MQPGQEDRAVGLGLVLATQNPVDLDYKALSNARTWLVGRLQTTQDRARVLTGLGAAGVDTDALDTTIADLPKRAFVWRAGADGGVLRSRQTLSYLRGPLGRAALEALTAHHDRGAARPVLRVPAPPPEGVHARWLRTDLPDDLRATLQLPTTAPERRAAVLTRVQLTFDTPTWHDTRTLDLWVPPGAVATTRDPADAARAALRIPFTPTWLHKTPAPGDHGPLPRWLTDPRDRTAWTRAVAEELGTETAEGPDGEAVRVERGDVRVVWVGVVWV